MTQASITGAYRALGCGHSLLEFDRHEFCLDCRDLGLGPDACITDPSKCVVCLGFNKEQRKLLDKSRFKLAKKTPRKSPSSALLDDALLDTDSVIEKGSVQVESPAEPSINAMFKQVMGTVTSMQESNKSLLERLDRLEKDRGVEKKKKVLPKQKKAVKTTASASLGAPVDLETNFLAGNRQAVRDRSPSEEPMETNECSTSTKSEDSADKKDRVYGDTLESIKNYLSLDYEDPPSQKKRSIFGDSAEYKEPPTYAMPPVAGLEESWDFHQRRADGRPEKRAKDTKKVMKRSPLNTGQFLPYARHNMRWYEVYPQEIFHSSPRLQENFKNVTKSGYTPLSSYQVPVKQFHLWETVLRENLQAFHNISYFQQTSSTISSDIAYELANIQKSQETGEIEEACGNIKFLTNLLGSTSCSMIRALDTVFDTSLTLALNMLLARRDNMLKQCHENITETDLLELRISDFTTSELFPYEKLKKIESEFLQRKHSRSSSPKRKPEKFQQSGFQGGFQGAFNRDNSSRRYNYRKPEYKPFPSTKANRNSSNTPSRGSYRGRGQRR